jgi:hypothetical protein
MREARRSAPRCARCSLQLGQQVRGTTRIGASALAKSAKCFVELALIGQSGAEDTMGVGEVGMDSQHLAVKLRRVLRDRRWRCTCRQGRHQQTINKHNPADRRGVVATVTNHCC